MDDNTLDMENICTNIIQQGEDAKYRIKISMPGIFIQNTDYFEVKLSWGMFGHSMTITKDEMIFGDDENWYFVFNTDGMVGRVTAECTMRVPDNDFAGGFRDEVDKQYLCFVCTNPLPKFLCAPKGSCEDDTVVYTRTEDSDVASNYAFLIDAKERYLVVPAADAEGEDDFEYLMVLKTAFEG